MLEPLHAVYEPGCLPAMRGCSSGTPPCPRHLPRHAHGHRPLPNDRPFWNVNRPRTYEGARLAAGHDRGQRGAADAPLRPCACSRCGPSRRALPAPTQQPALVAVVGKSDSGKTTLIEALIPELRRLGTPRRRGQARRARLRVDMPGKDSWRHGRSGADGYVISCAREAGFVGRLEEELPLRRSLAASSPASTWSSPRVTRNHLPTGRDLPRGAGHDAPLCAPARPWPW